MVQLDPARLNSASSRQGMRARRGVSGDGAVIAEAATRLVETCTPILLAGVDDEIDAFIRMLNGQTTSES